jgi:hypothetical protein
MLGLNFDQKGQVFLEAVFVIPMIFLLFFIIVETSFIIYNWTVINFMNSNTAVIAAIQGQFTPDIRLKLAQDISNWTLGGKEYDYHISGTEMPDKPDEDTVYIYGTDSNSFIQRGSYIELNISYPGKSRLLKLEKFFKFITSREKIRLRASAIVLSEGFDEGI